MVLAQGYKNGDAGLDHSILSSPVAGPAMDAEAENRTRRCDVMLPQNTFFFSSSCSEAHLMIPKNSIKSVTRNHRDSFKTSIYIYVC